MEKDYRCGEHEITWQIYKSGEQMRSLNAPVSRLLTERLLSLLNSMAKLLPLHIDNYGDDNPYQDEEGEGDQ